MNLKLLLTLLCFITAESRPLEDERDNWNVHGHIVRVNEANSRRGLDNIPIEEEIVAVNEDPFNRPACPLFEGDLCLDPEDRDVVNHVTEETDIKRNVMRNKKKLWPGKKSTLFLLTPNYNICARR